MQVPAFASPIVTAAFSPSFTFSSIVEIPVAVTSLMCNSKVALRSRFALLVAVIVTVLSPVDFNVVRRPSGVIVANFSSSEFHSTGGIPTLVPVARTFNGIFS